jgi:hypothetical protein
MGRILVLPIVLLGLIALGRQDTVASSHNLALFDSGVVAMVGDTVDLLSQPRCPGPMAKCAQHQGGQACPGSEMRQAKRCHHCAQGMHHSGSGMCPNCGRGKAASGRM